VAARHQTCEHRYVGTSVRLMNRQIKWIQI
jgi:hypothetical protein